jgi:GMP synthase (glutamine-hydrolysing)
MQGKKIVLACSGGVCSNVMAALFRKSAEKPDISSLFIDTGFMREKEAETVSETLSRAPLKLELRVFDARKKFAKAMEHAESGSEKRQIFDRTFEATLKEVAEEEDADLIALGVSASATTSVAADQIKEIGSLTESSGTSNGFYTPLISLNRPQVTKVAEALALPPRLSDLVPFPSVGLSIRALGRISDEKTRLVRGATKIVEDELQYVKPTQYFAALLDNKEEKNEKADRIREKISDLLDVGSDQVETSIPQCRMSALADHQRVYLKAIDTRVTLLGSKELLEPNFDDLADFPMEFIGRYNEFGRCLYSVTTKPRNGKYIAVIRAISADDFSQANIARLEWVKLYSIAERIMDECGKVSSVYYDVTPKPPATIEFE